MVSTAHRIASAGLLTAALVLGAAGSLPASADPPPAPVTEFEAPPCPGTTTIPADLTVTGDNLDNYNAGAVVGLYESLGDAPGSRSFPPLCGVRYLSEADGGPVGGGPVSAWMFCSDAFLDVCHDTRGLDPVDANPKLTGFQQRVFASMVQHGFAFQPVVFEEEGEVKRFPAAVPAVVRDGLSHQPALRRVLRAQRARP